MSFFFLRVLGNFTDQVIHTALPCTFLFAVISIIFFFSISYMYEYSPIYSLSPCPSAFSAHFPPNFMTFFYNPLISVNAAHMFTMSSQSKFQNRWGMCFQAQRSSWLFVDTGEGESQMPMRVQFPYSSGGSLHN